ncbi:MAG TPA: sulfotransferase domain-containing protein, partial [Stellaceae bacterium]|nr:sulfotransferase domain-containing protein [Stellaceae bacterium]
PRQPEPKFFTVDELFARGLDYYAETWFQSLEEGRLLGEKSTSYLENRNAAERIYRSLPAVRLIFMLRNPVDRAYSNYLWSHRNGFETETFARGLALEEERARALPPQLRYARPFDYFSRGIYVAQLARFLRFFPREQILLLRTEDVAAQPDRVAAEVQEFLGVTIEPDLAGGLSRINVSVPEGAPPMPAAIRAALQARYREPNRELRALIGPDFPLWTE